MEQNNQVNALDFEEFFDLVEMVAGTLGLMATSDLISEPMETKAMMLQSNTLYDAVERFKPMYMQYLEQLQIKTAQTTDN